MRSGKHSAFASTQAMSFSCSLLFLSDIFTENRQIFHLYGNTQIDNIFIFNASKPALRMFILGESTSCSLAFNDIVGKQLLQIFFCRHTTCLQLSSNT